MKIVKEKKKPKGVKMIRHGTIEKEKYKKDQP